VFVAKLTLDLNTRLFGTYLGGNGDDNAYGVKVDSVGHITVTGSTTSTNYPVTSTYDAFQLTLGGGTDAFITTIQPEGAVLMQSTYLGGVGDESGYRMALSKKAYISPRPTPVPGQEYMYVDGIANITGSTTSSSASFPVSNPLQGVINGSSDAFTSSYSPYPKPITSYYITDVLPNTTMYPLGCQTGERDAQYPGFRDSLIILDFGFPKFAFDPVNGVINAPGTKMFGGKMRFTYQIASDIESFISGYLSCSPLSNNKLTIGIGTNNKGISTSSATNHGIAWANMLNSVDQWVSSGGFAQRITVNGANDIELLWNSREITKQWVDGYFSRTTLSLINFGDVSGCPQTGNGTTNQTCDNGWTYDDIIYVSNGGVYGNNKGIALPEIYGNAGENANQWYQISLYAYNQSKVLTIYGSLTQYKACIDHPFNSLGTYACINNGGLKDQPAELGWRWLFDALKADTRTRFAWLRWSSDIRWEYFQPGY